jgi:uncharacterized protein (DUF302 family)
LYLTAAASARAETLITFKSRLTVHGILDRLQKIVVDKGYFIVARVPHSEAAKGAGLTLRPTELMIFGRPENGTPPMICDQRAGIDLPLKALAWEDATKQVWLAMVDPQALKQRYALGAECDSAIEKTTVTVRQFLAEATKP